MIELHISKDLWVRPAEFRDGEWFLDPIELRPDVDTWCEDNIGDYQVHEASAPYTTVSITFESEHDATLFKLFWVNG